jgi:Flp pilus assembly protein TadD
LSLLAVTAVAWSGPGDLDRARDLYQRVEYPAALKILLALPQKDAAAHELTGRCYFMQADFKKATESFQKAVAAEPGNSSYHHWLGKTWGRRAETASPLTAPVYASRTRKSFEKAVELDPKNLEAINDLFEYYLQAPGFLGGGLDKAAALAEQIRRLDPVEHHYAQAKLAEKRNEPLTAEQQLRRAADLAPTQVGRVIDLAKFLARHGKISESEAQFARAEQIAPGHPKLLFERASTYIETKRNLHTARALLRKYLESPLTPDDPPREEAQRLLRVSSGG